MATYLENLEARRVAIAVELAALDSSKLGGMADVGGRDGGTDLKHQEYKMNLYAELEKLDGLIREASLASDPDPFEIETRSDVDSYPM